MKIETPIALWVASNQSNGRTGLFGTYQPTGAAPKLVLELGRLHMPYVFKSPWLHRHGVLAPEPLARGAGTRFAEAAVCRLEFGLAVFGMRVVVPESLVLGIGI